MHVIGAGGHSKVIVDILLESHIQINGVWDENPDLKVFMGYPVRGNFDAFKKVKTDKVIIAIGSNLIRKRISGEIPENTAVAIHPKSAISKYSSIGIGTVIMPNATINAGSIIGVYVIVNTNSSVDHDCNLGDFVHISPQAALGGNVTVGEGTHIGIGASVIQGIKIGKWATIGAGSVVIRDVPDYAVVVGNPGRIIKYNKLT
ncbi:acetyltransferase [Pedobacter panaciterrae]|uniref:Acetyltransferase n=1 Tax=Pedobacter panaciterrae TaxID=363849 RepID=A0ABU8NUQ5_9SPHI